MKTPAVLLYLFIFCLRIHAQRLERNYSGRLAGWDVAYASQVHSSFSVARSVFLLARIEKYKEGPGHEFERQQHIRDYLSLGAGLDYVPAHRLIMGPELYATYCINRLSLQLDIKGFTELTHVDPVLTPKVGFGRWVGLRYGRNFHLGPFRFSEIGDDCFELFIRLYFPAFNQLTQNYQTAL